MLERVDRIQMAVADAAEAAGAFGDLLGAEPTREEDSEYLNARRTILTLGDSEVELCAPRGAGIVRAHLDRWGPGLLAAGFSVASVPALRPDVDAIVRRLNRKHARFTPRGGDPLAERDGLWIHPSALGGLLLGVSRTTAAWEWSGRPELVAD
jgi:hypothetical protein